MTGKLFIFSNFCLTNTFVRYEVKIGPSIVSATLLCKEVAPGLNFKLYELLDGFNQIIY